MGSDPHRPDSYRDHLKFLSRLLRRGLSVFRTPFQAPAIVDSVCYSTSISLTVLKKEFISRLQFVLRLYLVVSSKHIVDSLLPAHLLQVCGTLKRSGN